MNLSGKTIQTDTEDEALMGLISSGNRKAFELLYDRYFDKLSWFARGFLKDEAAAEDVVQDMFFKLIEKENSFDAHKKFSTWVYTVIANRCKNILRDDMNRRRILQDRMEEETISPSFIQKLDSKLINACLEACLAQMSEKEQALYRLRFEQDLSIREIGAILDIPEGSVKSGLYYLIKKMNTPLMKQLYEK